MKWQVIPDNPARRVDTPKADKKQIQYLNDQQALLFMDALENESLEYRVIFSILLLTGMRRGELLGLEWPDIDFDAGVIQIRRTSQYAPGAGIYTDTTKTEQSKRPLAAPAELFDMLRQYRAEQGGTAAEVR